MISTLGSLGRSAHFQLGENQKAIDDLNAYRKAPAGSPRLSSSVPSPTPGWATRTRPGRTWRSSRRATLREHKLYLAVDRGGGTGRGYRQGVGDAGSGAQESAPGFRAALRCRLCLSLASQAVAGKDQAKERQLAERALSLLRKAIENGYADYKHMQEDTDLDPLRDLPAFAEIMKAGHLDRSYAAVWTGDVRFEASPLHGLDPAAHLQRCRELASQGYRMVALSVAQTSPEGPPIAASVWHRPVITEETKDRLAERQARAAIALLRMGKAAEVLPLAAPQRRPPAAELHRQLAQPSGSRPQASSPPNWTVSRQPPAHPRPGATVHGRHAVPPRDLAAAGVDPGAGDVRDGGLSPGEREPLIGKLLDLYRNDPDSGIHGAAAWTLRQWGQEEKLKEAGCRVDEAQRPGQPPLVCEQPGTDVCRDRGAGRVPHGLATDRAGPNRRERDPHRRVIPRRFAIAAKEVTVEQYQRFVKDQPGVGSTPRHLTVTAPTRMGPGSGRPGITPPPIATG